MTFVLLAAAAVLLAAPRLLWWLGRRLQPREWVHLGASALFVGLAAVEAGLVLLATPAVLRSLGITGLAAACSRMLGELAPRGVSIGWSAALLAVAFPLRAGHVYVRARRRVAALEIEPCLGDHVAGWDVDLVVLPTATPIAYSVAMASPQIVVSQGLVDALDAHEYEAVVRHELAHLRNGHQRLLLLLSVAEMCVPPLRWSTSALRTGVERWADEEAAGADADERATLRDALLRLIGVNIEEPAIAAFTTASAIVERIRALSAGPPSPRRTDRILVHAVITSASVLGAAGLVGWLSEAHMMFSTAAWCRWM